MKQHNTTDVFDTLLAVRIHFRFEAWERELTDGERRLVEMVDETMNCEAGAAAIERHQDRRNRAFGDAYKKLAELAD